MKRCVIWPICFAVLILSCSKKEEKGAQNQGKETGSAATDRDNTRIPTKINGKWGYTDANGDTVIAAYFDNAEEFFGGLARVKLGDKWTFITSAGKMIVAPQFDEAGDFHDGRARVKLGDKWGFIKFNGEIAVSPQFDEAADFSNWMARRRWRLFRRIGARIEQ
jgi:hypothetical protein